MTVEIKNIVRITAQKEGVNFESGIKTATLIATAELFVVIIIMCDETA